MEAKNVLNERDFYKTNFKVKNKCLVSIIIV